MLRTLSIRTGLASSPEPNPFGHVLDQTASSFDLGVVSLLQKIDDLLAESQLSNPVAKAERYRTQLRQDSIVLADAISGSGFYLEPSRGPAPSQQLDSCLQDLQTWLGVGLDVVARAAGLNRGTVYAWRRRSSSPRPSTVGAVLRLHSLVKTAVAEVGEVHARAFFR